MDNKLEKLLGILQQELSEAERLGSKITHPSSKSWFEGYEECLDFAIDKIKEMLQCT